jgi:hypothetical protein
MDSIDPETMTACRVAASRLVHHEPEFIERLSQGLAALPDVPNDPRVAEIIGRSVLRAALFNDPPDVATALLQQAGGDLFRIGFGESARTPAGHALLRVLREVHPEEWDSAISSAWIGLFFWVSARWAEGAALAQQADEPNPASTRDQVTVQAPSAVDDDDFDDEDDDAPGYGSIMLSMTRGNREKRRD